ncbi:Hint domain-containing protein [Pseudoprimorskyibacter insulae]|uniref:Hedgehog/Intein (Hint) domain-containing protein n=1 Tax=Pseudoprimorskyibacter insulae TaxID=1695997 RepID=A0A2R8AP45_9RHOB|nr:Hint domain-containing protein [Pseudoprimorskyibacter insulae]SPF77639.1 hypothetical protein PRI8871_00223 [Pseudoprimorskyibacter insulae]
MSSLTTRGLSSAGLAPTTYPNQRPDARDARPAMVMRKYQVLALGSNGDILEKQVVAPAVPMFEDAAGAFARGTLITTDRGPVAVEDLLPGDMVETDRGPEPIAWIGSTVFVPGAGGASTHLTSLTRVTSEAFGMNKPMSHILLGPASRMVVRREALKSLIGRASVLVPTIDFQDGDRVFAVTPPSSVQLYHIALKRHGLIMVGSLGFESYHPGRNAATELGQNMRSLFLSMFPHIEALDDFGELTYTRTTREVIDNLVTI